jgi:hypothetical protein
VILANSSSLHARKLFSSGGGGGDASAAAGMEWSIMQKCVSQNKARVTEQG